MKRRTLEIIISLFALLLLCSCTSGSQNNSETNYIPKAGEYELAPSESPIAEEKDDSSEVQNQNIMYHLFGDYKEHLAWVNFSINDTAYWGVIDQTGKMVFRLHSDGIEKVVPYSNGFAYVLYTNQLDIIDTEGITVNSYPIDEKRSVLAYGDGYVFTMEDCTGFDSTDYTCTVYDPAGSILNTFVRSKQVSARYFGKGVFGTPDSIYFSKSNKLIENISYDYGDWDSHFNFYDDIASAKIDYYSPSDSGYRGILVLLDSDGQSSEVELYPEIGWIWSIIGVKDGLCMLYEHRYNYPIIYNINAGTLTPIPEEYVGRTESVAFESGKVAVAIKGADGKSYVAVFDEDWNMIINPIKSNSFVWSENILITTEERSDAVRDSYIYDEAGKQIYSLSETGYGTISPYSDGVARVSPSHTFIETSEFTELFVDQLPAYLDKDGELIFDAIDMSAVIDR